MRRLLLPLAACNVDLVGQGVHDDVLLRTHLGILNSPDMWQIALEYLTAKKV